MPNGWNPMPLNPPYRVMITGCGTPGMFESSDEDRRSIFLPRFKQMISEWEELGARPIASFVDDVFQMGETTEPFWAWYLIFEVDRIDVAAQMIQAGRQAVDGVRLDKWIRLNLRIGRPFFAREEKTPHYVVDPESGAYRP
jgi:hypothetical protein